MLKKVAEYVVRFGSSFLEGLQQAYESNYNKSYQKYYDQASAYRLFLWEKSVREKEVTYDDN